MKHILIDTIQREFALRNDKRLAEFLKVQQSEISNIRVGRRPIGPAFILKTHKATEWPVKRIEELLAAEKADRAAA